MRKIELIIEKEAGHFWGRVEGKGFMPTDQGATIAQLIENVKDSIRDYQGHEGKRDKIWARTDVDTLAFDLRYDLAAFFEAFDFLNLTVIAKMANMNRSLLNQYVKGLKHASADQARKIEIVIHALAKEMMEAELSA